MRVLRAHLPWMLSIALLLVTAATALGAGSMGPTTVNNRDRYWNSPEWRNQDRDNWAEIALRCRDDNAGNDPNDWVTLRIYRHQGIFPPRSVGDKTFDACRNTIRTRTWADSAANDMDGPENFHFEIRAFSYNGGYDGSRRIDLIPYEVTWGR